MRFSRKLRKLFSRELFASASEHLSRALHPVNKSEILADIDWLQFKDLRNHYPYRPGSPQINRFEDIVYWIDINVERAQDLWLDRAPPLRILDLGCGAGYFLYVCKHFGHDVLGFDIDSEPLFGATTKLLDVPRVIGRIERQTPLRDFGKKFDVVTAHRICFHRIGKMRNGVEWSPADWKFFVEDVRANLLNENGRLLLDFNPRPDGSSFFTRELREFFLLEGARLFRSKALLAKNPNVRPRFKVI
ncbi:MAG TPA: methyltransferase domain-containing protein [Chthoniobacterales bacterium]|jgi:SAM-dependent methyltransferase|nr:methyltransferase domain-containing protein [Chthoniobacterales bacterium]